MTTQLWQNRWLWLVIGMIVSPPLLAADPPPVNPAENPAVKRIAAKPAENACREFAETFEQALQQGDAAAITAAFDFETLYGRMSQRITVKDETIRKGLIAGVKSSQRVIGDTLARHAATGGTFHFLRVRDRDDQRVALYRLVMREGMFTYVEFFLVKSEGEVRIADFLNYSAGELMSDILANMLNFQSTTLKKNVFESFMAIPSQGERDANCMKKMIAARKEQKHAEVLEHFAALSGDAKKQKTMQLIRIVSLQHLNEADYLTALTEYRERFPDDASLDMLSIDQYVLKKDYDSALATLDRIDKNVGGDPFLNCQRAAIHLAKKDIPKACELIEQCVGDCPALWLPRAVLLETLLAKKEYQQVLNQLDALEKPFQIDMNTIVQLPSFASLITSPEYEAWKKKRSAAESAVEEAGNVKGN